MILSEYSVADLVYAGRTLDEMVKELVLATLLYHRGNQSTASRHLDIDRGTLARWLKRWNVPSNFGVPDRASDPGATALG